MSRVFSYFFIILILFTHSAVAMDVHIVPDVQHIEHADKNEIGIDFSDAIDANPVSCIDAGGHCSHHQAHTIALVAVNAYSDTKTQSVLHSILKLAAFVYTQAPPLRPPKV